MARVKKEVDIIGLLEDRDVKTKQKKERVKKEKVIKIPKKVREIREMADNTVLPPNYHTVWTERDLDKLCEWLDTQEYVAVDTETTGLDVFRNEIVGISLYAPDQGFYIPLKHNLHVEEAEGEVGYDYVKCLPKDLVADKLRPILQDATKKYVFHNYKYDAHILHNWMGIDVVAYFDTMVAQSLLDENQSKKLKDMATLYLKIPSDKFGTLFGKEIFSTIPILVNKHTNTGNLASFYAIKDAEITFKMFQFQMGHLNRPDLKEIKSLMFDLEMPFSHIVLDSERRGIRLDADYLTNIVGKKLHEEATALKAKIDEYLGDINLRSPAQLSVALFDKLKLPKLNKKKPYTTDKKTLKKLRREHEVISFILDFRSKSKLADAFADKLPDKMVDGKVHTSFQTLGARTGRMSSNTPNLQQVPKGSQIRSAFIADDGRLLACLDFSGQEMRWLAHHSKDQVLLDMFANGKDAHSLTATGMWNMENPDNSVDYGYFQYCRELMDLFHDADGVLVEERFSDVVLLDELFSKGSIQNKNPEELRAGAVLGVLLEAVRNKAKVVNFGRAKC